MDYKWIYIPFMHSATLEINIAEAEENGLLETKIISELSEAFHTGKISGYCYEIRFEEELCLLITVTGKTKKGEDNAEKHQQKNRLRR